MKARHWILIALSLASLWGLCLLAHVSPGEAIVSLIHGSLGTPQAFSETLRETTPLLISGVAVFIALQAGLFNIGVEGQLIWGALTCAAFALKFPGPPGMFLGTLGAMVVGALWALPAGLIKAYRGGHEVITTIMLNNVAIFITDGIVNGALKDPSQETPTTKFISTSSRLPALYSDPRFQISSAIVIGVVILLLFTFWLKRFVGGFELRMVGSSARVARLAGISTQKTIVWSMVISGAVAGLAGAVQVMGYEGRYYSGFSPGFGFTSLGVALLAGSSPLGLIPSALFFGILTKGSVALQILGVPKDTSYIVLGLLIAVFAAVRYRRLLGARDV